MGPFRNCMIGDVLTIYLARETFSTWPECSVKTAVYTLVIHHNILVLRLFVFLLFFFFGDWWFWSEKSGDLALSKGRRVYTPGPYSTEWSLYEPLCFTNWYPICFSSLLARVTNEDGRCPGLVTSQNFIRGTYKILFDTGKYFQLSGVDSYFYPYVEVSKLYFIWKVQSYSFLVERLGQKSLGILDYWLHRLNKRLGVLKYKLCGAYVTHVKWCVNVLCICIFPSGAFRSILSKPALQPPTLITKKKDEKGRFQLELACFSTIYATFIALKCR